MPQLTDALLSNPEIKYFRVLDSAASQPKDWPVEPLPLEVLSDTDGEDYYVIKGINVLSDETTRDCYIDMSLPERVSDFAFFLENGSLRFDYYHQFPGEIIAGAAMDCFGVYEQYYSRLRPDVGIEVLRRGLALAKRKGCIAENLGYILRDEERWREAAVMFEVAIEEGPGSLYIYRELALIYAKLGDTVNERKYMEVFRREENAWHK